MERNCSSFSTLLHRGRLIYVEARLQGGAPWGFTLKGGLEHGEALIISKVEEGGKADLLQHPLLVGDEVVNINEVELSGSRQEAISLVKGSYKSLQLTVCRDSCLLDPCCSEADAPPCLSPPYSHGPPRQNPGCPSGVELRIKNRRSEPASRPHSWHSTKLGEGQPDSSMTQISQGSVGTPWHQTYHSSASTTDLSSYDPGYLRKSPDQYSSRGSMESLDHGHPAYSSCQRLSPSKSSGSIDHLHSKRDSAYSSFSTSSSVPEYPAAAGLPMGTERSYSADSMLAGQQRGPEAPRQADIRYVRTVYDAQQGISEEHEVSTAGFLRGGEGRAQAEARGGGSAHRSSSSGGSGSSGSSSGSSSGNSASNRHSVGPVWGSGRQHNSYESLKGAPPPPQRSDSFAAIRNHERPSSWSSLEQARSMRSLYKGSWHHSSGSVAGGKPLFATEGQQLHTLEEKSPESSPTTRPRQGLPQAPSMGRLMLPTGIYQVPPPEPHFAQAPATCPNSSSVYPALAKESRGNPAGDWSSGAGRDGPVVENGYQSSSTSSTTGQPPSVPQPKSPSQQMDRQPEELQASCSLYRPHFKPHAESHTVPHLQGEEHSFRRDPYTPVQQRGERQRHLQGPESMEMYTQAQDEEAMVPLEPSAHLESALPQTNVVFSECRSSLGGPRDGSIQNTRGSSGAPQSQQSEHGSRAAPNHQGALQQEHPLTRLENALAEVQKAAIPERRASQSGSQGAQREEVPAGRVSVLEKVSRFEQQHRQGSSLADGVSQLGKLRSQSTSIVGPESRAKSFGVPPHMRTQSYSAASEDGGEQACLQRRRSTEHHQPWSSPQSALQRSKSTFHLGEENGKKDFLWREDLQDILGTIQDTSFNTAYRDSLKDAQSKVLRSTSFRRKDLSVEQHPSSKHLSLERKGPKTLPKPHTPKERHMVTPELGGTAVPALPSVPPVGPPTVRIGGRKRLTVEQKKRCYSEPEKMNEVGVSEDDGCLSAYGKGPDQLHLAEASVADRRRLFELAAHRSVGPGPNLGPWPGPVPGLASSSSFRSDLKQLQHDALAEYMERKTGRRVPRSQRPQSAYLQPPSYSSDSQSLSSTSSLLSLQDPELQEASGLSAHHKGGRVSSTLPPGLQGYLYPSGNPARPPSSSESTSSNSSAHKPRARPQRFFSLEQELDRPVLVTLTQPPQSLRLARHCDKAFERAAPARTSGKSASAEDLLDRSEEIAIPQHFRSRSSPSVEKLNQDAMTEYRLHTMFSKEPAPAIPTETRAVEGAGQFPSQQMERYLSSPGSLQLKTPVSRRDKQRQSERQRAQSMSGLAASVGLPCPFSSPRPSDSLSQASLEVLAHGLLPAAAGAVSPHAHTARKSSGDSGTSGETLTDVPVPVAAEEVPPAPSGEARNSPLTPPFHHDLPPAARHGCPSPAESPVSAPATPLPFLRISESSIHFSSTPPLLPEEDEVFLPPPPPPPASPPPLPLPIWEEDFPPPPPPPPVLPPLAAEGQEYVEIPRSPTAELSLQSTYSLDHSAASRGTVSPVPWPLPVTPDLQPAAPVSDPGTEAESPPPASVLEMEASWEAQESLELEYPVLSKRERSAEEVRVETLARELLSKDKSLTPVLDNWAVQKAMELMEEVFPASVLPRQQRTSSRLDDRRQDRGSAAEDTPVQRENGGQAEMETDLDEEELDLSQKKVELVQALSQSVAVLRGEKEALAEEQRRCSALSARVEALVKELCRANEYEKYRMFVGDLERMVGLLLSLCGQLARVESGLSALEGEETQESAEERETLQKRRRKLCGQHEDALELKENLDRRERLVLDILGGYLSGPQLREYQRLVRVKPALLIRQRRLEELIRHGEGQLHRLGEHLQPGNQDPALRPGPCASPPPPCSTAVTSL